MKKFKQLAVIAISPFAILCFSSCNSQTQSSVPDAAVSSTNRTITLEVVYPDGSVYKSSDNGAVWYLNDEKTERPITAVTVTVPDVITEETQGIATLHCWSEEPISFSYNDYFEVYNNGEWVKTEDAPNTDERRTITRLIAYDIFINFPFLSSDINEYKYVHTVKTQVGDEYCCIIHFTENK